MKDRLIFDTTDAASIADSDSVGAFVRAGDDGTQIGHVADALKVSVTNASIAVTATALDIRALGYATDNVAIKGATGNELVVNADGSINVMADVSIVSGSDKAEDAAHASGDIGTYILAVRQDTLANSVSADGDYASLKVDATGALYVNVAASGSLTVSDAALAATAIANAANPLGVADTAEAAVASALANRKYLWIYNNANTKVFLGSSGVTAANGFPLSPGSYMELRAGAALSPFFVGQSGKTPEIRTMEIS
jgi:hypothetical protein